MIRLIHNAGRLAVILFLFLFLVQPLSGQVPVPSRAYYHLIGTLAGEIPVTLEMIKAGDTVYCNYELFSNSLQNGEILVNRGVLPEICGRMDSRTGSFLLFTPFSDREMNIKGSLVNGRKFTGTWQENSRQKYPFEWNETYPEGSVQFNVSYTRESMPLVKKAGSPKAKIAMVLLTPAESSNPVISDSLMKFILEKFANRPIAQTDPQQVLASLKSGFFQSYISTNQSLYEQMPDAGMLNWESLRFMHIIYNSNHLLTFGILQYAFTGGAHGLETTDFYVINLKTGRQLLLSDLFKEGAEKQLEISLTESMKRVYCKNPGEKLTDAGFFTDEVKPTANFFITSKGIGFHYNQYEIAPYAFGAIVTFLDFSEIRDLLRTGIELPIPTGQ